MKLRADHIAGGAFVAFGALIIAISGSLPTGQLSMPGAGFLPKIVATLMMLFGALLVFRAGETKPVAALGWSDAPHALQVIVIAALATALYTQLGFIITMVLLLAALLLVVERRRIVPAAAYSIVMVVLTYSVFAFVLKAPLPQPPFLY